MRWLEQAGLANDGLRARLSNGLAGDRTDW